MERSGFVLSFPYFGEKCQLRIFLLIVVTMYIRAFVNKPLTINDETINSSIFSGNSEAFASKFLENIEKKFIAYIFGM